MEELRNKIEQQEEGKDDSRVEGKVEEFQE